MFGGPLFFRVTAPGSLCLVGRAPVALAVQTPPSAVRQFPMAAWTISKSSFALKAEHNFGRSKEDRGALPDSENACPVDARARFSEIDKTWYAKNMNNAQIRYLFNRYLDFGTSRVPKKGLRGAKNVSRGGPKSSPRHFSDPPGTGVPAGQPRRAETLYIAGKVSPRRYPF